MPLTLTVAALGRSIPEIMLSKVVFPLPDAPTINNISPKCATKSTLLTAVIRVKRWWLPARVRGPQRRTDASLPLPVSRALARLAPPPQGRSSSVDLYQFAHCALV